MPLPLKHAAAAAAAAILAAAFAAPQLFAKPSSYLGMGAQTGSPSGDVRAAIKSDSKKSDLIMSRPEPAEGGALAAPSAEERPAILNGLALSRPIRIGVADVMEHRTGFTMIASTRLYIKSMFGEENVNFYLLNRADLSAAIRTNQVDFFIADPDSFALEQSMGGVEELASLWPSASKSPLAVSASVLFMKREGESGPEKASISAALGKSFAAGYPSTVGGWLAAAGELSRRHVYGYEEFKSRTSFTGSDLKLVVDAVKRDGNIVGILPACEFESMVRKGYVSRSDITVLGERSGDGLTCVHSTDVYPGPVFATLTDTDPTVQKAMTAVLLGMSGRRYGAEWALPVTNRSVFDLYYELKEGPYRDLAGWSLERFLREHAELIAVSLLMLFMILGYATILSVLVRRRTKALRSALDERDRIEAEAAQSRQHIANLERTGIVGQMSTIIAHELKQPLGAITNYGHGLLRRLHRGNVDPKSFEEALTEMVDQAERAAKIVDRVRSYAKHDYPPRQEADLSIIIENAIRTFRRSRTTNAQLVVRMHSHSMAEVDSWEIELAVLNLLKNAADAISGVPEPRIEVELKPDSDGHWLLTVGDNGPYLSDEQLSHFFKPLQTSKGDKGMGLGLSIVSNIAERHAGNITVARNGARGVKFTITLPRLSRTGKGGAAADDALGPDTVSVYGADSDAPTVSEVDENGEPISVEKRSALPHTVHSGGIAQAVEMMEDGGRLRRKGVIEESFKHSVEGKD
jgi:two-component system, LuxR family, sensor histidine kinase TtrS